MGSSPVIVCLSAGGNHLLGAELPAYMNATCRTRLLQYVAATIKDSTMRNGNQPSGGTVTLVGMDAHTRVLSLCIAEWRHGSDPKVWRNIPGVRLEDMEEVYPASGWRTWRRCTGGGSRRAR